MNTKERELLMKVADALDIMLTDVILNESLNFSDRKVTEGYMRGLKQLGDYISLVEEIYNYLKKTVVEDISITDIDDYSVDATTAEKDGNRD